MRRILLMMPLLVGVASSCLAHVGDRLVHIFEINDDMILDIDIHDGSIEDWLSVIGEPTLTAGEFMGWESQYDPADFDFRVWLAWHRSSSRVYVAVQGIDDEFVEGGDGGFQLEIDGDHSGGIYLDDFEVDEARSRWQESQMFTANAYDSELPPVIMYSPRVFGPTRCCWFNESPFAEAGWAVVGENPAVTVAEMYVTPFDRLVPDDMDETEISVLLPGKVIGFRVLVLEEDNNQVVAGVFFFPYRDIDGDGSDQFSDGLLVAADGSIEEQSVVHLDSWGRIKASLRE